MIYDEALSSFFRNVDSRKDGQIDQNTLKIMNSGRNSMVNFGHLPVLKLHGNMSVSGRMLGKNQSTRGFLIEPVSYLGIGPIFFRLPEHAVALIIVTLIQGSRMRGFIDDKEVIVFKQDPILEGLLFQSMVFRKESLNGLK